MVDSCRSRATCIGHWVFFEETMFWWQLHSTSSLGVPGRTADRRWFQVCNDHRHGDLSGIVLANSDRGSIWFPPASRGYQFIYMEDFSQPSYHVCRERSFGKNLLQVFPGAFSQQKIPLWILWKSMQNDFVAHTSCVPAPLAIGATNPPGSFLQGKACIRMPRQRWSLALVASPQKGCGKSFVQCRIVRWYEMFRCLSFDGWVVWKCDIYVGWSAMTSNFDGCS